MPGFTHLKDDGSATMVDVGHKDVTRRIAVAGATVCLSGETLDLLLKKALPKGDALNTAKVAGVLAAKRTHELIPFCHPLPLDFVDLSFDVDKDAARIHIRAEARTSSKTGVEMEALTAVQVAALTIYDMCKAVQKDIRVTDCRLLHKSGGKSGDYNAV